MKPSGSKACIRQRSNRWTHPRCLDGMIFASGLVGTLAKRFQIDFSSE